MAAKDDAWFVGTLELSRMDIRKLRASLAGLEDDQRRMEGDEDKGMDLDANLGNESVGDLSPEAREKAKLAADGAAGASSEKTEFVTALKKAGLEQCMPVLFENGATTLTALCDLEDAWLVEKLALSRMDLRKLRAVAPSANPCDSLDANALGTTI